MIEGGEWRVGGGLKLATLKQIRSPSPMRLAAWPAVASLCTTLALKAERGREGLKKGGGGGGFSKMTKSVWRNDSKCAGHDWPRPDSVMQRD